MSYTIEQSKKGWIASRGSSNTLISDNQLHAFLVSQKALGFKITFKMTGAK